MDSTLPLISLRLHYRITHLNQVYLYLFKLNVQLYTAKSQFTTTRITPLIISYMPTIRGLCYYFVSYIYISNTTELNTEYQPAIIHCVLQKIKQGLNIGLH